MYHFSKPSTNPINTRRTIMSRISHSWLGLSLPQKATSIIFALVFPMKDKGKKPWTDSTLYPFIQLGYAIHSEISQMWYHKTEVKYRNKDIIIIFIIVDTELSFSICDTLLKEKHTIFGYFACSHPKLYLGEFIFIL